MDLPSLKVRNLTFSYENKTVFDNLNVDFKANECSAIMAKSGSGKTTLLNLIAGLLSPVRGEIIYPIKKPKFSYVFQENRLLEYESVAKNLLLVNNSLTMSKIRHNLIKTALYDNYINKKICRLSGGEKRRIAILRAMLTDYDILLLDEPFTGLDEQTKGRMINYVKELTNEKTVLFVTHNESEVNAFGCSSVIKL